MKTKSTFILTVFVISAILTSSFSNKAIDDYGPWTTTSCFRHLEFCVRKVQQTSSGRYEWRVKFRNNYDTKINFSCAVRPNEVTSVDSYDDRFTLASGAETSSYYFVDEAYEINVFVGKMRFGSNDSGDYAACD